MARCNDCGAKGEHHPWCGVKYLDNIESAGLTTTRREYEQKPGAAKPVWQKPSLAGSYNVILSPAHYARFAIQPIDFIEANGLDFLQASVLKYLVRFPFKNGVEDLHKARDMLNRLIKREEEKKERLAQVEAEADRACGKVPELAMPYTGEAQPRDLYADMAKKLMGDAGQEVGGQPSPEHSEGGTDRGGGAQ